MAHQTTVLQVFVASPSDVSEERGFLEILITQLNQVWSRSLGITYELIKWETNVRPAFSTDPQAAINNQIGNEYDVFIGIFWGRLGTSTPRASSGTIEEFENAYARFKKTGETPEIMIYFKDAPIPPSKIDATQLQEVLNFKNSLSGKGGLYSVFEDQTGFESSLRAHLSAIAQSFVSRQKLNPGKAQTSSIASEISQQIEVDEDDYGYIDYFEIYELRQGEMLSAITSINEATIRIGEQLAQRSTEVDSATRTDAKDARRLIKRAADDMSSYADTMKNQLAILSTARQGAFNALSNALAIQGDFSGKEQDLQVLRDGLTGLISGVKTAEDGMLGMRSATNSLPRISKEINKAKRSVVQELDAFLSEVESTRSTVVNIIESIDRMRAE